MSNQIITVQGIYACMPVADFPAALDWYTRLMGRAPDDRPLAIMAQWRNMGASGIQVWHEPEHAGHGRMTVVIGAMAEERMRLVEAGIELGPDNPGPWGIVAQLTDPEGNRLTLAEPPKGFVNR